ncbi:hypothetical protein BVRB_6g132290 [Beta vulgaris subsp. vulgaris]|nr:hypothetical protein BVRB_6g132290 [Beta vulgaris subsp. vulgaris]
MATKENMENLVNIGQELLKKPASRVDPETGLLQPIPNMGTNADVLTRMAERLSNERKFRKGQN